MSGAKTGGGSLAKSVLRGILLFVVLLVVALLVVRLMGGGDLNFIYDGF